MKFFWQLKLQLHSKGEHYERIFPVCNAILLLLNSQIISPPSEEIQEEIQTSHLSSFSAQKFWEEL